MSNPDHAAAPDLSSQQTFESQVSAAVAQLVPDENGVHQFPEGLELPPEVRYAAMLEKRRRDTESALGKTKAELKAEQAKRQALQERVNVEVDSHLSDDERTALDHLKETDPNAWRVRMNQLEAEAKTRLEDELNAAAQTTSQQAEMERRGVILADFNHANPDLQITNEVLENDVPPRITKKLAEGKITFEEFLEEVKSVLSNPKVVGSGKKPPATKNLSKVGGGLNPAAEAVAEDFSASYKSVTF